MTLFLAVLFANVILPLKDEGVSNFDKEKYAEALKFYTEEQLDNPDDLNVKYNMATTYYKMQDYTNSETLLNSVIERGDDKLKAMAHYNLGNVKFRQGDLYSALQNYNETLRLDPTDEDAAYNADFVKKLIDDMVDKNQQRENQNSEDSQGNENKEDSNENQQQSASDSENQQNKDQQQNEEQQNEQENQQDQNTASPSENENQNNEEDKAISQGTQAEQQSEEELSSEEVAAALSRVKEGERQFQTPSNMNKVQVEKDW